MSFSTAMSESFINFFVGHPIHFWAVSAVFGVLFLAALIAKTRYSQLRCLPLLIAFVMWLVFGFFEREALIQKANIRIDVVFIWPVFFSVTALLIILFILSLIRAVRD